MTLSGVFDDDPAQDAESPESVKETGHEESDGQGEGPAEGDPSESGEQRAEAAQPAGTAKTQVQPMPKKWADKYDTPEEAEEAWREAQKLIGSKATEISELRRQLAERDTYLQWAMTQLAMMQQQSQAPMQQAQPAVQPEQLPWKDETEFLDAFQGDPMGTIKKLADIRAAEQMNRFYAEKLPELAGLVMEAVRPIQEQFQAAQFRQQAEATVAELRAKYPDFDSLRLEIRDYLSLFPELAARPGGLEIAYRTVKGLKLEAQSAQQVQPMQQQSAVQQPLGASAAVKAAARMPGSTASMPPKPKTPEQLLRETIFGPVQGPKGVFSD